MLWVAMLVSRAVVALIRNRNTYRTTIFWNVARLGLVVPIIATLDAATFSGTFVWLVKDKAASLIKHDQDSR